MEAALETELDVCHQAGEWFLRSGIQETSGGVARYYLSDRQRNAPLSTEITGYSVSALVSLYEASGNARYLEAARNAAEYLVRAWDVETSAMPFEYEAAVPQFSYFFDDGIIVRGLLSVWRQCGDREFLSTAISISHSMAKDFCDGEQFSPILSLPDKAALPYEKRWSRSPGCYQLKAALAWRELWEVTNEEADLTRYRNFVNATLRSHSSFLPRADDDALVMDRLHAYSYFLEGLLPVAEEKNCAEAIASGIQKLNDCLNRVAPVFLRSDVVAQLLRVRLFAHQYGILTLDEAAAAREIEALQNFQLRDADARMDGGFWFGRKGGGLLPFVNPVSTAFSYQAFKMWSERGRGTLDWHDLI